MIDTSQVTGRRALKFTSSAELLADAAALVAAEKAGTLRRTGNWTLGEIFTHVAAFMNYPYDGYPPSLRPPWWIKLVVKAMKNRFLRSPLPTGYRIPGIPAGTVGAEKVSSEQGLEILRKAWARLDKAPPSMPNPVFGPLSHDEWKNLHYRHAELHQSFVHPN